jgi:hypothetical protein
MTIEPTNSWAFVKEGLRLALRLLYLRVMILCMAPFSAFSTDVTIEIHFRGLEIVQDAQRLLRLIEQRYPSAKRK